jgi:hypothetical protein
MQIPKTSCLSKCSFGRIGSIVAVVLASAAVLSAPVVRAAPNGQVDCPFYTYYSNAKKVTEVGSWHDCLGGVKTGRKTPWFTVVADKVGPSKPLRFRQSSKALSCDLTQNGCGDLPKPR